MTDAGLALDDVLASARGFGDSVYIHKQKQDAYERRLAKISDRLPPAARLVETLGKSDSSVRDRVLGDTVLRCAVQHALTNLETGAVCALSLAECGDVFDAAAQHVREGRRDDPLQVGLPGSSRSSRLGEREYHGLIWSEEHDDDVFGRAFRELILENYGAPLCTPSAENIEMLRRGTELLETLVPSLARSALSHARMVAVFPPVGSWNGRASSSQFRVSATIFLHRDLLVSPWWVAEHLLHEALHQKLYDFRHGHSLLAPDYQRADAPSVCALWNISDVDRSNYWDVHRVLAACHVYVHLSLLATLAEKRHPELADSFGPYGYPISTTGSRPALHRARYLGEELQATCWNELGLAGKSLVQWLMSVLDVLDPAPPPPRAHLHLILELYGREVSLIQAVLDRSDTKTGPDAFPHDRSALATLAVRDLTRTTEILRTLDAEQEATCLSSSYSRQDAGDALARPYPSMREQIIRAIRAVAPDGYQVHPRGPISGQAEESIREMVQQSSQDLDMIVRGQAEEVARRTTAPSPNDGS